MYFGTESSIRKNTNQNCQEFVSEEFKLFEDFLKSVDLENLDAGVTGVAGVVVVLPFPGTNRNHIWKVLKF